MWTCVWREKILMKFDSHELESSNNCYQASWIHTSKRRRRLLAVYEKRRIDRMTGGIWHAWLLRPAWNDLVRKVNSPTSIITDGTKDVERVTVKKKKKCAWSTHRHLRKKVTIRPRVVVALAFEKKEKVEELTTTTTTTTTRRVFATGRDGNEKQFESSYYLWRENTLFKWYS